MVIYSQYFLFQAPVLEVLCTADNCIHCLAGLLRSYILVHHLIASARINQMIKAYSVYIFPLNEIKYIIQLLDIVVIDSKSETYSLAHCHAVLYTLHSSVIGPLNSTEAVIDILKTVKRYSYIADTDILYTLSNLPGNQRTIGGKGRSESLFLCILCQLKEIWSY